MAIKYKSNNATMGEICAEMLKHEKNKKPISSNKDLVNKINEIEAQPQYHSKAVKSAHYNAEGEGPI
jgi:hypothetical protein